MKIFSLVANSLRPWKSVSVPALCMTLLTCSQYDVKETGGFSGDVQNIIFNNCVTCHAGGASENGLGFIDNPTKLIDEGYVIPGDAKGSTLYLKTTDTPPFGQRMPFGGPYLSDTQVGAIGTWINGLGSLLTVSVTAGHATFTPNESQKVRSGKSVSYTVTADSGYTLPETVGGTCPAGTWAGAVYTTGAIISDCDVQFGSYTVTPASNSSITMSPSSATAVAIGKTLEFTLTPASGKNIDKANVGGDCAAGTWSGNNYTTGAVVKDCSITFKIEGQLTVSASSVATGLTFDASSKSVDSFSTASFTLTVPSIVAASVTANTPSAYTLSPTVTGTCPSGSWNTTTYASGSIYTTGTLTANCTVIFKLTNPCGSANTASSWTAVADIIKSEMRYNTPPSGTGPQYGCGSASCHSTLATTKWSTLVAAGSTPNYTNVVNGYTSLGVSYAASGNLGGSASNVKPGDPLNSRLYRKVTSGYTASAQMPKTIGTGANSARELTSAEKDTICNWIYNGALNN